MNRSGKKPRRRMPITASLFALCAVAFSFIQSGCLGSEAEGDSYLRFRNPELTAGLDSLHILGVNARKGDTLLIRSWHKGEDFPNEAAYPPGLEAAFTLLVRGYVAEVLVYESRTPIAGGEAQGRVRDFRLAAPALSHVPVSLTIRVGDTLTLHPAWTTRPGIYRQADSGEAEVYTPEAEFAWSHLGTLVGRDSVLALGPMARQDSGAYLFAAGNPAGRDSLEFKLTVGHMLPRITNIKSQAAIAGKPLTVKAVIAHSDSLLFRWMKDGITISTDTALAFDSLRAKDTGNYQLAVANASDTTETDLSNRFAVAFAPDPSKQWKYEKSLVVGAQANSAYGTALDLDYQGGKVMFHDDAQAHPALIDLLFVWSGKRFRFMSALAARRAKDLSYADGFDSTKLSDVKLVRAGDKPVLPAAGGTAYDKGSKADVDTVAAGDRFLLKTPDSNIVWLKVESIRGDTSAASANLTVDVGQLCRRPAASEL
jgi:hypothetical protein